MENGPFHEVGNLFPGEVSVETVSPDTTVIEALKTMLEHRYSQLPVADGNIVRGVFSLWSLAHQLATAPDLKVQDLLVEDVMENLPSVTVSDSLEYALSLLEQHEAILVNSPRGLQAIATSSDLLRYFYHIARPFILLQEIELGLRSLIDLCAPLEKLTECIDRSIAQVYKNRNQDVPTKLSEMSFEDYRSVINSRHNWHLFEGVLGRNRELVSTKLSWLPKIRNNVFHFRSEISVLDYQTLVNTRNWLLDKMRRVEMSGQEKENV